MSPPATGTLTDHIQQFRHNGPPGTREAHCFARTAFQASGLRAVQRPDVAGRSRPSATRARESCGWRTCDEPGG